MCKFSIGKLCLSVVVTAVLLHAIVAGYLRYVTGC